MVYVKLAENLYQKIKPYVAPEKLVICEKQTYVSYPEFSKDRLN
jgi:hypothetical protein